MVQTGLRRFVMAHLCLSQRCQRTFAAFLALRCAHDADKSYLVVRNARTKQWMLPGGKLERGETARTAARRETLEESGYDTSRASLVKRATNAQGVVLYEASIPCSAASSHYWNGVFGQRTSPGETDGYGFACLDASRSRFVVRRSSIRSPRPAFRKGTIEHLNVLFRAEQVLDRGRSRR